MSGYYGNSNSSENCNQLKLHMKENSGTVRNESIDYDAVKQFDELISELSRSGKREEEFPYSYNLCAIVQENVKNDVKVFNDKLPSSEKYKGPSVSEIKASRCRIDPVDNKATKQRERVRQNENQHSAHESEESISWIDSNLWCLENEKQLYQSQISVSKSTVMNNLTGSSKEMCSSTKPASGSVGYADVSDRIAFHTKQASKQRNVQYSGHASIMKNDYRFPLSKTYFGEIKPCKFNFQPVTVSGSLPLQNSPRTSRTPVSKYILPNNCFVVKLFVETRDLHLGPFPLEIYPKMTLRLLKLKVEQEHGIISSSQRWILGKCFAADNDKSLVDYNVMPGSSVILYVDNNQRILYDASKNQFVGVKSITLLNSKMVISNTAEICREPSTSLESKCNKPEEIEVSELSVTDSFDSVPIHSCSKAKETVRSQNSEKISLPKEQDFVSTSGREIYDKTKSSVIKKKGLKKSTDHKSKTKTIVPVLSDIPKNKCDEMIFCDKPKSHNLDNDNVFIRGMKPGIENLHTPLETELVFGKESNQYQEVSMNNAIAAFPTNYSDISNEYNQPSSLVKTATMSPNSFLRSSIKEVSLPGKLPSSINDVGNKCGSFNFEINNATAGDVSTIQPQRLNVSNGSEINTSCDTAINGRFLIDNYNHSKYIGENLKDNSTNIVKSLDPDEVSHVKTSHYLENSNVSNFERVENILTGESLESSILKPKRSVSSLIRKLSLTRKGRSLDDSDTLESISSYKIHNERTDENPLKHTTLISSQSQFNDIHIEISAENSDCFPLKDDNVEQWENELPVEDHTVQNPESIKNFELLLEIENMDLVENPTNFTCPVCFDEFESGQGVILHDCLHVFCRVCLISAINYAYDALVKCPYRDDFYSCQSHLQQREIKALVSEDVYEKYLQRSIITAEGSEERSFHCKTLDCPGWCVYDNAINVFHCPVCFHYNCLNCQAIHEGLNCRQYQDKLKLQQKTDQDAQKTLELLNKMIEAGKAIRCPKCDLILMKKWGCDWLKCSICQTEICWITKGPRWGPGGQGDTSGGCRCGVNGVKCHPSCTYCH